MYDMWILQKDTKEVERVNKIKERLYTLSLSSFNRDKKHDFAVV
jgi:hypothetical protein